jgi:hypothetical protein
VPLATLGNDGACAWHEGFPRDAVVRFCHRSHRRPELAALIDSSMAYSITMRVCGMDV